MDQTSVRKSCADPLINLVLYILFNDEVLYNNTKENYNTSIEKTLQFIELSTL